MKLSLDIFLICPCRLNYLRAKGAAHIATGRWPKLQELDIS
jgi:hypothetical protein